MLSKNSILDHTVTTFVTSKEGKQLSTRRVLFHVADRTRHYNTASSQIIQEQLSPVSVALCPTPRCVRECTFCSNTQRNKKNREINAEYSENVFSQIIDDLNNLKVMGVSIAGGGEPLAYDKGIFYDFLAQESPPYKIGIHTNGVLLMKILTERVVNAGNIKYINVSVVAHTPTLYQKVARRGSSQFFAIECNLKKAITLSRQNGSFPTLGVKVLLNRDNFRYVSEIKGYFESLGIENVLLRCVSNFEPNQDVELSPAENKELSDILSTNLNLPDEQVRAIVGNKTAQEIPLPSRCWIMALQYTAGIDPDGETYLCSPWSRKEYSIGNINDKRFRELWGSDQHHKVAEALNNNLRNNLCNPLSCRHYYSNLAIDAFVDGLIGDLPKNQIEEMYGYFI